MSRCAEMLLVFSAEVRRVFAANTDCSARGVQVLAQHQTTCFLEPDLLLELQWALRKQATPAQISLAWLMAQKPWIVPIPGTKQMPHMLEDIGSAAVRFTPTELVELNRSVSAVQIRGLRLPDAVLVFWGVEAAPKTENQQITCPKRTSNLRQI